jgi:hypothetical protein
VKYPEGGQRGLEPVVTVDELEPGNPTPGDGTVGNGVTLAQYVVSSPNQEDGGTCIYMASTSAIEVLYNQQRGRSPTPDGPGDFSERFLMNAAEYYDVGDFSIDTVFLFNEAGGGLLNRDFRYTKGWYIEDDDGIVRAAEPRQRGAEYGTPFNWVDGLSDSYRQNLVQLPRVTRRLIHTSEDLWDTAVMTDRVVEKVKEELRNGHPVIAIYNHFAYWHATVIVGYDDSYQTGSCPVVREWLRYMEEEGFSYEDVEEAVAEGGCKTQGAFLVRDSIYEIEGTTSNYDYDMNSTGEERPYVPKVVMQPYDWLKYLGNHAYSVSFRTR